MVKPDWWFQVYWSLYTSLAFKIPNWKYYNRDSYLNEFIIFMRMRFDMLKYNGIHTVMYSNDENVEMPA